MNNDYLIPANTKKSKLILGFFTGIDLAIFAIGCSVTLIMLVIFQGMNFTTSLIVILPALISKETAIVKINIVCKTLSFVFG